jgi:NADP-dependent 3-hydroxy acid dehydrogenase YdfG
MTKTWFITGTSSGFGRIACEQLLSTGHSVAASSRNIEKLNDLAQKYPDTFKAYNLDITQELQCVQIIDQAISDFGKIDMLISNAGYALAGAIEEAKIQQIHNQFEVNVIGSLNIIRALLPHFRENEFGRILQLSSMGGHIAFAGMGYYQSTKWAMECLIEALIQEVVNFNIQACLIEPGAAATDFGAGSMQIADAMPEYENTAVGAMRSRRKEGKMPRPNDPQKIVAAMIDCALSPLMPRRLALGVDAYEKIKAALEDRLAQLEINKDVTLSTSI